MFEQDHLSLLDVHTLYAAPYPKWFLPRAQLEGSLRGSLFGCDKTNLICFQENKTRNGRGIMEERRDVRRVGKGGC